MGIFSRGSIFTSALSVSVSTIGAGVLVLPSANQEAGILVVLILLILDALLTIASIDYLVICVERLDLRSYEDISRELLGRVGEEIIRWVLITYTIGIAAGYIVVVGEIFTPLIPYIQVILPFACTTKHVIFLLWALVMLPLSCIRDIHHIHNISFIAVLATALISSVVVYRFFAPLNPPITDVTINYYSLFSEKALLALPIIMFSFDCQALVFQVFVNLRRVSRFNMLKVSVLSVFITGVAYALIGIFGYLSFPGAVNGNILNMYNPLQDHIFAVGVAVYSITVIIAYCLVLFPCRDAILILLYGYNPATMDTCHARISTKSHYGISIGISFISFVLAISSSGIMFIIALLGGLCSSTVCFLYPALFRLSLHARGIARCSNVELVVALSMLFVGLFGGLLGTYVALLRS